MEKIIVTFTTTRLPKKRWNACRNNCAAESIFQKKNKPRVRTLGVSTNRKTNKELAFLQDLFVAPDWGERFAELIDEHLKLPNEGKALYIAAGTGSHAMALHERAGSKLDLLCVDENPECLELARAKAIATEEQIGFDTAKLDNLKLRDSQYDLVIGNASLVSPQR